MSWRIIGHNSALPQQKTGRGAIPFCLAQGPNLSVFGY